MPVLGVKAVGQAAGLGGYENSQERAVEQEVEEVLMVHQADAIEDEAAVVVHFLDADAALAAVVGALGLRPAGNGRFGLVPVLALRTGLCPLARQQLRVELPPRQPVIREGGLEVKQKQQRAGNRVNKTECFRDQWIEKLPGALMNLRMQKVPGPKRKKDKSRRV